MKSIYRHELGSYFTGITAYVIGAVVLFFAGMYSMVYNLKNGYPNFEYVLSSMCIVFVIVIPIVTMRVIAEERKQKTDQLLYSLPVTTAQIVLGKYLALATVLAAPMAVMAFYPLVLSTFGTVSLGTAYGTLVGFYFLGAALLAIGMFISSLTESQAVAAGLCFLVMLLNFFLSSLASFVSTDASASLLMFLALALVAAFLVWVMTKNLPAAGMTLLVLGAGTGIYYAVDKSAFSGLFATAMEKFSLFDRFETFVEGVFDIPTLVYFASIAGIFLFLTVQSLEKRRYS